ncbi:hypothetical protein A2U01_0117088, partial [Trifolium medium]|nr:hypothetical protein [Trifolium medium]
RGLACARRRAADIYSFCCILQPPGQD